MYLREAGLQLLYNGTELAFSACFGLSAKAFDSNVTFLDGEEDKEILAYICSEQIVTYKLFTKEQEMLIRENPGTATFLSTVRKREGLIYMIGERYKDSTPELVLISADKKPQRFPHFHLQRNAFISQAKMPKETIIGKNVCVTLSNAPHTISVWRVDKQKLIVEKATKIANLVFDQNPENPLQIVVGGSKYLKLWEINPQEGTLEESQHHLVTLKFEREADFLDLKYLPNGSFLLALVNNNRVLVFENYEQTRIIGDLFSQVNLGVSQKPGDDFAKAYSQRYGRETLETASGNCLIITPRGFCVGGSNGFLAIYAAEEGHPHVHIVTIRISPSIATILHGSVSSDGNYIVFSCSQVSDHTDIDPVSTRPDHVSEEEDLLEIKQDFFLVNLKKLETELPDPVSMIFSASQHYGAVRDVAVSLGKNQIVTVGEDLHLRIWHKNQDWSGVIDHRFVENPLAVAVHPMGLQIAVGFRETFKVFAVLESELLGELDMVVKACYAVSYSSGGKYLAANNGGAISIYSPYTLRVVASFTGHSSAVHSLTWDDFDTTLTSACFGGTVVVWDVPKAEQRSPTVPRQGKVLSAFYDDFLDLFALLTNDGTVKILKESAGSVLEVPNNGAVYTSILLSRTLGLLLLGTSTGKLRTTLWPIIPNTDLDKPVIDFQDFQIHSQEITKIQLSDYYGQLVTVSTDGSVIIQGFKLVKSGVRISPGDLLFRDNPALQNLSKFELTEGPAMNSLALVHRNAIEVFQVKIKELEDTISTLKSQQKYALESKDHKHSDEMERLRREFEDKIRYEQEYAAGLRREIESKTKEHAAKLETVELDHQMQLEDEVRKHEHIQIEDQERYDRLKDETEDLKRRMSQEMDSLLQTHKDVKHAIESECKTRLEEVKAAYNELLNVLKHQGEQYETGLLMTEKEYEDEINTEKQKMDRLLDEEREQVKNLRLVNTRLNTDRDSLAKRDELLTKETESLGELVSQTRAEVEELKSRLAKMQEQISEREEVIKKKENTIKELRSFNIHLQNFRFVLDQKIKTLKEDRGPLGEQLTALQGHIRNMYAELLDEFEKTRASSKQVSQLQATNRSLSDLNAEMRHRILSSKRKVALIQNDLVQLMKVTNKDSLLMGLKQLIEKHLDMENMLRIEEEPIEGEEASGDKVRAEVVYQHDLMKEQLIAAQKKSKATANRTSNELARKMQENATLIQECNLLRDENKELQRENVTLKDRISKLKSQMRDQVVGTLPEIKEMTPQKNRLSSDNNRGRKLEKIDLGKEKNRLSKTVSRPDFRITTLISELERNRQDILEQNSQFRKLQEQVSNLLIPEDSVQQTIHRDEVMDLPQMKSVQTQLSHSTTSPTLRTEPESFLVSKHISSPDISEKR